MIEIKNVFKSFGENEVLNDLSLTIKKGSIFGLVGINGAGKSTLLRMISGVYNVCSGNILIEGEEVYENPSAKRKIFFLPDDPYFSYRLTGDELKDLYKSYYNFNEDTFYKHLNTFKLDSKKPIHNYSKGMKRQIFISLAIACEPEYILLDEAFDGLDPLARLHFKRALIELSTNNNTTVIISSHALRELEDICDSYGLIDHNTIISEGEINNALTNMHKYQFATNSNITKEMIKSVEVMSIQKEGRLYKVTFKGNENLFLEEINKLNPIFIDKVFVSFEDLFIEEVEARGYLKWNT